MYTVYNHWNKISSHKNRHWKLIYNLWIFRVDELAVISDDTVIIRVVNDGTLTWTPGGVYKTQCSTDVTYYPFDTQVCSLILTTWGYTNIEITLNGTDVDLSYYEPDGEWEFISNSVTSTTRTSGPNTVPQVSFEMKFKRRPAYQVMNTILPMMFLGFLSCFVFRLPTDSGEKMGYSLTTLLAFAVYLTIVSAEMPTTSIHTAFLCEFLIALFSLILELCYGGDFLIFNFFFLSLLKHLQDVTDKKCLK